MSAQFFGRSGKVLYGAFSIVGMASQPHNVNKGIPDDRVARSNKDHAARPAGFQSILFFVQAYPANYHTNKCHCLGIPTCRSPAIEPV